MSKKFNRIKKRAKDMGYKSVFNYAVDTPNDPDLSDKDKEYIKKTNIADQYFTLEDAKREGFKNTEEKAKFLENYESEKELDRKKVEDVSPDPEKVSNVMALLKRNKESNEPSPEAADQVELPEKKEDSGFWSGVGKSFSGENLGEALAYFSPDIIGGILGYALGGNRGALEGLQHANKLRLGVDEQRRKDREFNQKQNKILQKAPQQSEWGYKNPVTGQISPAVFQNGRYYGRDINGNIVEVSDLVNLKNTRQTTGFENRKKILDIKDEQQREVLAARETKGVQGVLTSIEDLESQIKLGGISADTPLDINKVKPTLRGTVGILNKYKTMARAVVGFPTDSKQGKWITTLNSKSNFVYNTYIKALSGVAVNPEELKRASALIPNKDDHWRVFVWKTAALKDMYKLQKEAIRNHFSPKKREENVTALVKQKKKEFTKLKSKFKFETTLKENKKLFHDVLEEQHNSKNRKVNIGNKKLLKYIK